MKKKIIDLTIREMRAICNKHDICSKCPLFIDGLCAMSDSRWISSTSLNKEVEAE